MGSSAPETWQAELAAWAIPDEILAQAEDDPWGFPPELFAAHDHGDLTPSHRRALEALPEGGSVLDVGSGGGRQSRPLRVRAGRITAVDQQEDMLRQVDAEATVLGRWPDVAEQVEEHDVVVCGHVLYNVPDIEPFLSALTAKSRHRVVVEITAAHPLTATTWLWEKFWGLSRPSGPTWNDAVAVLREMGIDPQTETFPGRPMLADAAFLRRRLCLPRSREGEVRAALEGRTPGRRDLVTIWWS